MKETVSVTKVAYTLEYEGKFMLIEGVPARVCRETGEQFFSPDTVEHLHALIKARTKPVRMVQTPVYHYR